MTAELISILARHTGEDRLHETIVPGLRLMRWSAPSLPIYASRYSCLALLVQGAKSLRFGDEELCYGAGQYLLAPVDLPVTSRITQASPARPLLGLAVSIDAEALRQVTRRVAELPLGEVGSAIAVHPTDASLLDAVVRLARLLDQPEHAAGLAPAITQEILYWLLVGPSGGRLLQLARHDSPSQRITRAMLLLREQFASPLRVEDLAKHAGMSASSFHDHFKAICSLTPLQYQKHLRLQEGRRLLLAEALDVGSAAFQVGYESPSHFGKDYRRYFGRSPREDITAMRGVSLTDYQAV